MATNDKSSPPVVFNFGSQSIRTIDRDGEIWFVASDVCSALEIANPTQAVGRLDDDERAMVNLGQGNTLCSTEGIPGARGNPNTNIISESGLYSLVMSSRKAEAKQFKRWVTHEVLPTIRKTGRYEAPQAALPLGGEQLSRDQVLEDALNYGRWFMSAHDGRLSLKPVPEDAYLVTSDEMAKVIREPGMVPLRCLPDIISAAASRLSTVHGRNK